MGARNTLLIPRTNTLLVQTAVLARRRKDLGPTTRAVDTRPPDQVFDAEIDPEPGNRHGRRLRKRYAKIHDHLLTFLNHRWVPSDNKGSECELSPTVT